MLLNWLLKLAFRRSRPTLGDYVHALQSYSFPSGHTAAATLLYGLIAAYLVSVALFWLALCTTSIHTLAPARRVRALTWSAEPMDQQRAHL